MHPELQRLQDFYLQTRRAVAEGRVDPAQGIAAVTERTVVDGSGRRWSVSRQSPPDRARFMLEAPGSEPRPADPAEFVSVPAPEAPFPGSPTPFSPGPPAAPAPQQAPYGPAGPAPAGPGPAVPSAAGPPLGAGAVPGHPVGFPPAPHAVPPAPAGPAPSQHWETGRAAPAFPAVSQLPQEPEPQHLERSRAKGSPPAALARVSELVDRARVLPRSTLIVAAVVVFLLVFAVMFRMQGSGDTVETPDPAAVTTTALQMPAPSAVPADPAPVESPPADSPAQGG